MQDHHPIAEFPANLAYRLRQVGIVGDNQRRIKGFVEGVDQQPGRQVDIRSLLFNLEHLHQRRRRGRCRERMPRQLHRFPRIRALMEMQPEQRPQCPEVGILPDMLIGIVGIGPDPGGEIMNILDLVSGKRQLAEGTQVQPLIWGIHQAAVISIESVDVDVQDHVAWTVKICRPVYGKKGSSVKPFPRTPVTSYFDNDSAPAEIKTRVSDSGWPLPRSPPSGLSGSRLKPTG